MSYFYGEAKSGKKLHMGSFRVGDEIDAFCGCSIHEWEQGERPPKSKVSEYCKNCFRAYAWQAMVIEVGEMARLTEEIERLIETPFVSIATMKEELSMLIGRLRQVDEDAFTPHQVQVHR